MYEEEQAWRNIITAQSALSSAMQYFNATNDGACMRRATRAQAILDTIEMILASRERTKRNKLTTNDR